MIAQVEPVDCQRAPSERVTRINLRRLSEILDRLISRELDCGARAQARKP
jgi:hypothetical protein